MTQRQNKPASNNGSARQSGGNRAQDEVRFFNLITSGIGYLNRVRKVTPDDGGDPYWACDINALVGESSAKKKPAYRLYQCKIVGAQAFEVLDLIDAAKNGSVKSTVLISFRIGDSRPTSFSFHKDDGRGNSHQETRYCNKARLLKITSATVNKIPVELPQYDQDDDQMLDTGFNDFGNEGDGQYQGDGMHDEQHFDEHGDSPRSSERQPADRNGSVATQHGHQGGARRSSSSTTRRDQSEDFGNEGDGQYQGDGMHDEQHVDEHGHSPRSSERQPSRNGAAGQHQFGQRNVGQAPRQPTAQSQGNGNRSRTYA